MRRAIAVAVLALLILPSQAIAQRERMGLGESLGGKVTRADKSEFDIGAKVVDSKVVVDRGEIRPVRLPSHIGVAYGFLIQWGKGRSSAPPTVISPALSVSVRGQAFSWRVVRLGLPFRGLTTISKDGVPVAVKVASFGGLTLPDGSVVTGTMTVNVEPRHDAPTKFKVVGVTVD